MSPTLLERQVRILGFPWLGPTHLFLAPAAKKKRKRTKKKKAAKEQSSPPRVLLSSLFPGGSYPEGEMQTYQDENLARTTTEEARYISRQHNMTPEFLSSYREAAEVRVIS